MSKQFLDKQGLSTFFTQLKGLFATKTDVKNLQNELDGKASSSHTHGNYMSSAPTSIEFTGTKSSTGHGGFIDFHYNGSTSDYTSRIIESASGTLSINGGKFTSVGATYSASDSTETFFRTANSLHDGHLCTSTTGKFGLWSNKHSHWLIYSDYATASVLCPTGLKIDSTCIPNSDNTISLGANGNRWKQLYAGTTTIATSDRNQKKDIVDIEEDTRYIDLFNKLIPVSYKFIDGESGRTHIGFVSQDVEKSMTEVGLSDLDFAGFCKDQKTAYNEETGEDELVYDEDGNPEYNYALRYSEFIALNTKMIQITREENKALRAEIDELKEKLALLESKIA